MCAETAPQRARRCANAGDIKQVALAPGSEPPYGAPLGKGEVPRSAQTPAFRLGGAGLPRRKWGGTPENSSVKWLKKVGRVSGSGDPRRNKAGLIRAESTAVGRAKARNPTGASMRVIWAHAVRAP